MMINKMLWIWIGAACLMLLALPSCQKLKPAKDQKNELKEKQPAASASKPNSPSPSPLKPRAPRKPPELLAGAHILIAYKGSARAKPSITRSKEEALKLAKKLAAKARKNPLKFEELAKKHSDGPSGRIGGSLGAWPKGRMVPAFDKAIDKLKIDEISDPVETPFGYHVMIRKSPWMAGSHILIAYKGAARAKPDVTRSKAEAIKLAKQLSTKLKKDPSKFSELAQKHSNGPSGPKGGSLGKWPRGRMVPAFNDAIDKLKVGEVSDPVETQFGVHVILRADPAKVHPPKRL